MCILDFSERINSSELQGYDVPKLKLLGTNNSTVFITDGSFAMEYSFHKRQ